MTLQVQVRGQFVVCLCTHHRTEQHTRAELQRLGESVGQLLHLGGNGQINELVANVHHEAAEDAGVHMCSYKGENKLDWRREKRTLVLI